MEHEFFCPAFQGVLAALTGEASSGPCSCGADGPVKQTATATQEPPAPVVVVPDPAPTSEPTTEASAEQSAAKPKRGKKPKAPKQEAETPVVDAPVVAPPVVEVTTAPVTPSETKDIAFAPMKHDDMQAEAADKLTPVAAESKAEAPVASCCGRCWGDIGPGGSGDLCASCSRLADTEAEKMKTRAPVAESPAVKAPVAESPAVEAPVAAAGAPVAAAGAPAPEKPKKTRKKKDVDQAQTAPLSAKPTSGDREVLLAYVSKHTCVGCRHGLLLEGEGMEAVISTGAPGELAFVSITSPDQDGEKWHRACLEQKVRIEAEGRIKVNVENGTYEVLPKKPESAIELTALCASCEAIIENSDRTLCKNCAPVVEAEIRDLEEEDRAVNAQAGVATETVAQASREDAAAKAVAAYEEAGMGRQVKIESGQSGSSSEGQPIGVVVVQNGPKRRLFVGIDPDINGYLAIYNDVGEVFELTPVPTTGGEKPVYDEHGMVRVAKRWKELGVEMVLLERQQALGKFKRDGKEVNMGSIANFRKGVSYGLWRGILAALMIPFDTIAPITWKKGIGIAGGDPKQVKGRAVTRTQSLHPHIDLRPLERKPKARVPDPSKAESILLSRYVMLRETGGLTAANEGQGKTVKPEPVVSSVEAETDDEPEDEVDEAEIVVASEPEEDDVVAEEAEEPEAEEPEAEEPEAEEPEAEAAVESELPVDTAVVDSQAWLRKMTKAMNDGDIKGPGVSGAVAIKSTVEVAATKPTVKVAKVKASKLKAVAKHEAAPKTKAVAKSAKPEKVKTKPAKAAKAAKAAKTKPSVKPVKSKTKAGPLTAAEKAMRRVLGIR